MCQPSAIQGKAPYSDRSQPVRFFLYKKKHLFSFHAQMMFYVLTNCILSLKIAKF